MAQRYLARVSHKQAEPDDDEGVVCRHGELREVEALARGKRQELDRDNGSEEDAGYGGVVRSASEILQLEGLPVPEKPAGPQEQHGQQE